MIRKLFVENVFESPVKFDVGINPDAGETYFYDVPLNTTDATALGWSEALPPPGPLPELVMYCPSDKVFCALYDDTEFIAGLQIGVSISISL